MIRLMRRSVFLTLLIAICAAAVVAQSRDRGSLNCRDENNYGDRLVSKCEIREQTLAPSGSIAIDGRQNGGVSVRGWAQNQVLVRSRVQAGALTDAEAETLAKQIVVETGGNKIFATGPENQKNLRWDVSYEVFVPSRSDVSVETHNGGIVVSDVNGHIEFHALNGGVVLRKVGGTVRGATTNGGLVVELGGDHWDGEVMDVSTTNGGVVLSVPENYSAHLETGTVNGGISVDFPVSVQGRVTKELSFNVGSGGQTVRATTTNGGVKIKRVGTSE